MSTSACLLDWDGTLRPGLVIYDWTVYLAGKGAIPERYVEYMSKSINKHKSNPKQFTYEQMAEDIVATYAASQKGLRASDVEAYSQHFSNSTIGTFEFAEPLIAFLRNNDIEPVVISGSPLIVVEKMSKSINVNNCYGLELTRDSSGLFTGTYDRNLAVGKGKGALVEKLRQEYRSIPLAFGNSESDHPLLDVARIAYYIVEDPQEPDVPERLQAAHQNGTLKTASPQEMLTLVRAGRLL